MAELLDDDLVLVNRGGKSYKTQVQTSKALLGQQGVLINQ